MGKIVDFCKAKKAKLMGALTAGALALAPVAGYCSETASTPQLEINFDVTQMFTWAQTIISAMMPVVYVTMGLGLGFLIIRSFRSAFAG
ncbi:MAG: hypothetical protein J6M02_05720 [Clostridia bacterium]|nr:hypothetical protein [Clostridia bacterium]